MMRFSQRRTVLALAIGGLVFTSVACDSMESDSGKADRRVAETIKEGMASRQIPSAQSLAKSVSELTKAAAESGASATTKIEAKSLLAQAELESGDRLVRDLDRVEPAISRALWDIGQIAGRIQSLNDSTKAMASATPDATLKAIADKRAEMAAAGEAATKAAADIQANIDKVKAQVTTLTQQKDAAIGEADAAQDKATKANDNKGRVTLAEQAGESRRKGANLGHDIDKESAALLPLERDLLVEQTKKKTAEDAVAALDASKQMTDAAWQSTQAQIQAQRGLASKLGEELTAKAAELDKLSKDAAGLRAQAVTKFENAGKQAAGAGNEAKTLTGELGQWGNNEKFSTSAEKKAWEQLRNIYHPNLFKQMEADAQSALGNLYSRQAELQQAKAKVVAAVGKTLADAGLTVPPALAAADDGKAVEAANKAYAEAASKYQDSVSGVPKDAQQAARISAMFSMYGQYLNGDKAKLGEAKKARDEAFSDSKDDPFLRMLPADLRG